MWLCWDALQVRELEEAATHNKLAVPLRVAQFADGSDSTSGSAHTASQGAVRFQEVRRQTHCLFAARAIVWGNDWQDNPSCSSDAVDMKLKGDALATNVARCLPRFYRFCLEVRAGAALDGFVFEARGSGYCVDLASFAQTVRLILEAISAADPAGMDCMQKQKIGRRGWYFQFAREPLFITTFAPCYPCSHPRYQFDAYPDSCFVLFQPEESFYRHDLPPDRPRSATFWDSPADIRDRIRVNFRKHGREYRIPESTSYPPAEFIVAPLAPLTDPPVRFWQGAGET